MRDGAHLAVAFALLVAACGSVVDSDQNQGAAGSAGTVGAPDECTVEDDFEHPIGCSIECSGKSATCWFANSVNFICQCHLSDGMIRSDVCPPSREEVLAECD